MLIGNVHGLPNTISTAISKRNSEYSRGAAHRSATQLVGSPRIDLLRKKNFHEIEMDVAQEFWPLLGTAVHKILEMGKQDNQVLEERLFATLDGWTISGALDVQEMNDGKMSIYDYKVCTVYAVKSTEGEGKDEWIAQQNIYRWLVETTKGIPVESLFVVAIIRDWQFSGRLRSADYPVSPIIKISVPMWSLAETEAYIRARINVHRQAEMIDGIDGVLPDCTPEERWERPTLYKVKKAGAKRASRVFLSREEAEGYRPDGYEIEEVKGENVRCENNYCQVAEFCEQYARTK